MSELQRQLFAHLDDCFAAIVGESYEQASKFGSFQRFLQSNPDRFMKSIVEQFRSREVELREFYGAQSANLYSECMSLGGIKLVMGSFSHFSPKHADAVRKMLLYADSIAIPDPVSFLLEAGSGTERFPHMLFLEAIYSMLAFKPLVDAELPTPALLFFPSFETLLVELDKETRERVLAFMTFFFSRYLETNFADMSEVNEFAAKNSTEFMAMVERRDLFVAPAGKIGAPLAEAVTNYRAETRFWRSAKYLEFENQLSASELICLAIQERLAPQYHLLENSIELKAEPMICMPQQWHYYKLCTKLFENELTGGACLKPETIQTIRALNDPKLNWLGNVPIEALVRLRQEGENETFRRGLMKLTDELRGALIDDLDRAVTEVSRGLSSLIAEHQKSIKHIQEKYAKKHGATALAGWITAAVVWNPALAPILGSIAPAAVLIKYTSDRISEMREKRDATQSLMGVLASARR